MQFPNIMLRKNPIFIKWAVVKELLNLALKIECKEYTVSILTSYLVTFQCMKKSFNKW